MEFVKADLNKKFKINCSVDMPVRLPNGKECKLSEIEDEEVVQGMLDRKSNLVSLKSDERKALGIAAPVSDKP